MTVRLEGLDNVLKNLQKATSDVKGGVVRGIEDAALDLLNNSVRQAPVDTGALRGSASVTFGQTDIARGTESGAVEVVASAGPNDEPLAVIGYGEIYSLRQHEEETWQHPRGGNAKFLQKPFQENQNRYVEHIRKKAGEPLR